MKSEQETIYDYAAELKLLACKEELECTLSLAAEENWNHLQCLTELLGKESARRREMCIRDRFRVGRNFLNPLYEDKHASCNIYYCLLYTSIPSHIMSLRISGQHSIRILWRYWCLISQRDSFQRW